VIVNRGGQAVNPYEPSPRELAAQLEQDQRDEQRAATRQLAAELVAQGLVEEFAQEVELLNRELNAQVRRAAAAEVLADRDARRRVAVARVLGR
jgi:hypothetical protein